LGLGRGGVVVAVVVVGSAVVVAVVVVGASVVVCVIVEGCVVVVGSSSPPEPPEITIRPRTRPTTSAISSPIIALTPVLMPSSGGGVGG
jgi:hypothetical protein